MTWSSLLPGSSRRLVAAVGVAVMLCGGSMLRAQAADVDPLKFNFDGPMMLIWTVKAERTADFEALWAGIRAGLAKSDNAELKAFGDTLHPFKIDGTPGVYVFRLDPPSKSFTYNPVKLMYDNVDKGFTRPEADELYKKFDGAVNPNGIQAWKLVKVGG